MILSPENGPSFLHQLVRRAQFWAQKMGPVLGPCFSAMCAIFGSARDMFCGVLSSRSEGILRETKTVLAYWRHSGPRVYRSVVATRLAAENHSTGP